MTARVLIVDDLMPNVKMLEARLFAEYFDVVSATNGFEALEFCREDRCDIVLLDVIMPGLNGFDTCARLKEDPKTRHIPVLITTALDEAGDRLRGLEAGADDFLIKPIDEMALIARVHSLTRLKFTLDELRARAQTSASLGITEEPVFRNDDGLQGRILLVEDRPNSAERVIAALRDIHEIEIEDQPHEALFRAAKGDFELIIASLNLTDFDSLRLCSQLRSLERTRATPLLLLAETEDRARVLRGLDLGVNDYILRPIDRNELVARVRTQLRRKRYVDSLRDNVQAAMELAIVDPLTGLNNRRFLERHLATALDSAAHNNRPLSLMMLDIDHFKDVNDQHGHKSGDAVLRTFAQRIKQALRRSDVLCRLGGEEFVVVMPDTPLAIAERVGERLRAIVEAAPFPSDDGATQAVRVTTSIGIAERGADANADAILRRADRALYRSKTEGRNRVSATAA